MFTTLYLSSALKYSEGGRKTKKRPQEVLETVSDLRCALSEGRLALRLRCAVELRATRLRKEPPAQASGASPALVAALAQVDEWACSLEQGQRASELARAAGLSRARVSQLLRLRRLPEPIKRAIRSGGKEVQGWSVRRALAASSKAWG